jgi:hypothetical protein
VPQDSRAAATPATIIGFIFMEKILLGCTLFVKLKRKLFRRDRVPGQRAGRVDEQIRNGVGPSPTPSCTPTGAADTRPPQDMMVG